MKGLPANVYVYNEASVYNEKGDSVLVLAINYGHHAAARALLRTGADRKKRNDQGQTPILGAAFKGDTEMVELVRTLRVLAPPGKPH